MKRYIVALTASLLLTTHAFAEKVEVKGIGTIPYSGAVFSKDPSNDEKKKAIDAAKQSAWKNYVTTFNISKQQMVAASEKSINSNLDKFITEMQIIDQKMDKDLKTFSVVVRVGFDSGAVDQYIQSASLGAEKNKYNPETESAFSFLFTARKATSIKQFEERKTKVKKGEASSTATADENGVSTSASSEESSGGSTLRQEDKLTYAVTSSQDIDAAMGEVLNASGINYAGYDDVVGTCGGPSADQFQNEYVNNDELTAQTRAKIINAAKACEIKYFAIGTVDIGVNDTDPVSGNKRVFVSVRAQLWDIGAKPLPRKIGSVGPVQFSGMGPDQAVASKNALNVAAKETAKSLVDQLNAKKVR